MLWVKSFHIIFLVSWYAGLFYLPRLYVHHAMSEDPGDRFGDVAGFQEALREYRRHAESHTVSTHAREDLERAMEKASVVWPISSVE